MDGGIIFFYTIWFSHAYIVTFLQSHGILFVIQVIWFSMETNYIMK
jgi:hypothetical protein